MKAKLLKELMGVPAGTELEVMETGRSWTLVAPSGMTIVVAACDLEVFGEAASIELESNPPAEPLPESDEDLPTGMPDGPVDPTDPGLLVNIFGGTPIEQLEESQRVHVFGSESAADFDPQLDDDDLDGELLPAAQDPCEGDESCESCQ